MRIISMILGIFVVGLISEGSATGRLDAGVPEQLAQSSVTQFDGKWQAFMKSDGPPCADTYDYVVTIKNGEMSGILPAVRSDFDISGKVLANGDIKDMEASRFGQGMTFSGKFAGAVAEGNFDADSICGGTFEFTRKK